MDEDVAQALQDPARLSALQRTALLDSPVEEAFDRVTRLAIKVLGVPTALVSLLDGRRQFFKSCAGAGLPEPFATSRQTPLSHSFCKHVVASGKPLLIDDARTHPLVRDNPIVKEVGVAAYAGYPLTTRDGHTLGTLCAFDASPRHWTPEDVLLLSDLAAFVMNEIRLRELVTRGGMEPAQPARQARLVNEDDVDQELVKRLTERIRQQSDAAIHESNVFCPRCGVTRRVEELQAGSDAVWYRCSTCGHAWQ